MRPQGTPLPQPAVQTDAMPGCRDPDDRHSPDRPAHPPQAIQPAPAHRPPASCRGKTCVDARATKGGTERVPSNTRCPRSKARGGRMRARPRASLKTPRLRPRAVPGDGRAPRSDAPPAREFLSRQSVVDWNRSKHKNDLQSPSADGMVRFMGHRAESAASFHAIRSPDLLRSRPDTGINGSRSGTAATVAGPISHRGVRRLAPPRNGDLD